MHLYMTTRGAKWRVDPFISELQCQMVRHKWEYEGKTYRGFTQLAVRPIQLWEVVFPEDQLSHVLSMVTNAKNTDEIVDAKAIQYKMMQKGLRAKPLPKDFQITPDDSMRTKIKHDYIGITPFAIKYDGKWKQGKFKGMELL